MDERIGSVCNQEYLATTDYPPKSGLQNEQYCTLRYVATSLILTRNIKCDLSKCPLKQPTSQTTLPSHQTPEN